MLGTQTRSGRMEGADESTELWRHPLIKKVFSFNKNTLSRRQVGTRDYFSSIKFGCKNKNGRLKYNHRLMYLFMGCGVVERDLEWLSEQKKFG